MSPQNIESYNFGSHHSKPHWFGPQHFGPHHFGPHHFGPHRFGLNHFGPHNFEHHKDESHNFGPGKFEHHKCPFKKGPKNYPGKRNFFPWGPMQISNEENAFNVNLDVQQFKPEEVSVKVVDDFVVINGNHNERSDEHGFISRNFTRRYKFPNNVDPNTITSKLSLDGILSIGAPKKIDENNKERTVPIVLTNQRAMKPTAFNNPDIDQIDFALNNYEI
ncbi:alpha-crystallin A chain-like [Daktulosphaira vitifoliae]|uniref:alpha-crystallin A chain-like n=1 Tax=Daktulosphaira vitifoliae TaxID=58002 RepID=UPI0021AA3A8B|nr:alpha-crystallin A chain-like [Daktulosphaira vitifoliae]XP_050541277.1 alpha-crystallin A chain-like [Daktulosphaira vitifoliae]